MPAAVETSSSCFILFGGRRALALPAGGDAPTRNRFGAMIMETLFSVILFLSDAFVMVRNTCSKTYEQRYKETCSSECYTFCVEVFTIVCPKKKTKR